MPLARARARKVSTHCGERLRGDLREGGRAERERGRAGERGFQQISAGEFHQDVV